MYISSFVQKLVFNRFYHILQNIITILQSLYFTSERYDLAETTSTPLPRVFSGQLLGLLTTMREGMCGSE